MKVIAAVFVGLLPVFFFLAALIYYDSYKLVKVRNVLYLIIAGALAALVSYFVNIYLIDNYFNDVKFYSRYVAPAVEEFLKASFIIYIIYRNKIGFMADALIYGFAIGAGFSLLENIYYLETTGSSNIFLWIIRGFGTAIMHGGTTAIFSLTCKSFTDRQDEFKLYAYFKKLLPRFKYLSFVMIIPGFVVAYIIHSFFNHLLLPAIAITLLQIILLPALLMLVFKRSEVTLKNWMEKGLDNEVKLLEQIDNGIFSETHAGKYLHSLKSSFDGPVLADMLCMIKIHVELSIKAKGVMLFRKAGLPARIEEDVIDKLQELKFLEKSIGRTGKAAVSPIFTQSTKDLWQIYMLN
jgi:RsiW-degrading membrane proteinase PrsW (M82 family)